ncbi:hypothetical protein MRX96_001936 [Rhipicephalus microplus]
MLLLFHPVVTLSSFATKKQQSSRRLLAMSACGVYREQDGLYISCIFQEPVIKEGLAYKPKPGDVFIVSYPKCGTTWMQHIVYAIYNDGIPP